MKRKLLYKILFIIIPIITLMIISILIMPTKYMIKQLLWYIIGVFIFTLIYRIKFNKILKVSKYIYFFNILLLIYVLVFGKEINNSRSWISFKYFSIEPNEIMKISLILIHYYIIKSNNEHKLTLILISYIIPSILTFLEPDTGSFVFYSLITFISILSLKLPKKFYITLGIILLTAISAFMLVLINNKELLIDIVGSRIFYRFDRLLSYKNNSSLQLENALISIGAGQTLYIPEYHTDFFFAYILSHETLLFMPIFISYFILLSYLIIIGNNSITKSVGCLLIFQTFYNIAMNLGLVPIMGIPLPFLSYGGSNLITYFILLGVISNMDSKDNKMVHNKV